jgi:hypothetical protein
MTPKNSAPEDRRAKQALFQGKTRSKISPRTLLTVAVIMVAVSGSAYFYGIRSETAAPANAIPATVMEADQRRTIGDITQISYPSLSV